MHYYRIDGGSFQLYSIGFDGVDDGGQLNLIADDPLKTKLNKSEYLGDWPWPVEPRELPAAEE